VDIIPVVGIQGTQGMALRLAMEFNRLRIRLEIRMVAFEELFLEFGVEESKRRRGKLERRMWVFVFLGRYCDCRIARRL
jgi:hypothetical protein